MFPSSGQALVEVVVDNLVDRAGSEDMGVQDVVDAVEPGLDSLGNEKVVLVETAVAGRVEEDPPDEGMPRSESQCYALLGQYYCWYEPPGPDASKATLAGLEAAGVQIAERLGSPGWPRAHDPTAQSGYAHAPSGVTAEVVVEIYIAQLSVSAVVEPRLLLQV